jgi:hypothetical protein
VDRETDDPYVFSGGWMEGFGPLRVESWGWGLGVGGWGYNFEGARMTLWMVCGIRLMEVHERDARTRLISCLLVFDQSEVSKNRRIMES